MPLPPYVPNSSCPNARVCGHFSAREREREKERERRRERERGRVGTYGASSRMTLRCFVLGELVCFTISFTRHLFLQQDGGGMLSC
jgi:hypothetical protein